MRSQSTTFSLSWVLYLSQAWCVGVAVGGETRDDVQLRVFPAYAGLAWPDLAVPAPATFLPDACPCVSALCRRKPSR